MHMRRLIYGLALVLLFGAVPVLAAPLTGDGCIENPTGQLGCTKSVNVPDQNPTGRNLTTGYGNNANLTPDPTCADTLAGGWGIEDINEGATRHFVQCVNQAPAQDLTNPTYYFTAANEVVATTWHNPAGDVARIDLLPETSKTDEGNAAVVGTLAWALAQFAGDTPAAPVIHLAKGIYYQSTTITLATIKGGEITGDGPGNTIIYWANTTVRDPVFIFKSVNLLTFGGMTIRGTSSTSDCTLGCQIWDGVVVMTNPDPAVTTAAQHPIFRDFWVDGATTGINNAGVLFASPTSDRCTGDKAPWWICTADNRFTSAVGMCCTSIDGTGCNASEACDADNGVGGASAACNATRTKCVLGANLNNDFAEFNRTYVTNGIRVVDCTANGVPAACCTGDHAGATCGAVGWKVDDYSGQSVHHNFYDCHFGHLRYGVYANSFSWIGGGWSGSSGADFFLNDPQRPILIRGGDSEGSQRFWETAGPNASRMPIEIDGTRWANGAVIAASACTAANNPQECCTGNTTGPTCGIVGLTKSGGPLLVQNLKLDGGGKATSFKIDSSGSPLTYTARNNQIQTTVAADSIFAVARPTSERWTLQSNGRRDGTNGTETAIPDQQTATTFMDVTDPTKKVTFDVSGLATGQTAVTRPTRQACAVIENLQATDDHLEFWQTDQAALVTSVGCRCKGTCSTPATFTLENRAQTGMTIAGTNPTCATTGATTYAAVSGAAATLTAGDGVALNVTNSPTAGDNYTICISYLGQ